MTQLPSRKLLGRTGWSVSPIGFGSYRVGGQPSHEKALQLALERGCNLIDTSANYGDGESERSIGRVLAKLFEAGSLAREQVFVVSKAGYVQGENLGIARGRVRKGQPYPEMVEYSSDCWHSISPEFLEDQLTASLERLGLKSLDALLLHNPEYFLKSGGEHAEYYRRIEAAFAHLEKEAKRGRIRFYGVSSNTFPEAREAPDFTSLEAIWEIAEKQGRDHRFALIQFPFNLYEPGAAFEANNGGKTLLEYAKSKDLGTLINRPLNAFARRRLIRLADFPSHGDRDVVGDFKEAMTASTALEASYPESARSIVPARQIAWGHVVRENFERLADLDTWKSFLAYRVEPALHEALDALSARADLKDWASSYREASTRLFEAVTRYLENQASAQSDRIAGMLDHLSPELRNSATLSQKVIRLYRSIPGIDCVLLGMRQTHYVEDAMPSVEGAALETALSAEAAHHALLEIGRAENL
jgi:aryl-alcohol dehydrogenase-like predicted oxidoreductase